MTRSKLLQGAIVGLLAGIAALLVSACGWLETLENTSWDVRVKYRAAPGPATDQIALILLDQNSLDWGKEENGLPWPWPRETYAAILGFCNRGGAKAVVFDMIYTEPSSWGVEDDELFGAAIAETPGFVAAMSTSEGEINYPIPEVADNAAMLGNVTAGPSDDAIIRRVQLMSEAGGKVLPSLALAAYLVNDDLPPPNTLTTPMDKDCMAILRYRGPTQTHTTYNAAKVLQSEIRIQEGNKPPLDPSVFKDKYVFFGVVAHGLMDLKPTPISNVYPGIEIHATALDNLLSGDFIREAPRTWSFGLTILAGLLCGVFVRFSKRWWQTCLALVLLLPTPAVLGIIGYDRGIWLPVVMPYVALFFAFAAAAVLNYAIEGKQKRFIKGAFKQYLSPEVIDQLVKTPDKLKLGGEKRELSIFFSDLQGFTSISEGMDPETLTSWLNKYLTAMTDIIQAQNGTIDKFEGDAIIAFWNAPIAQEDHASRAVRAALHCQSVLAKLNPELKKTAKKDALMRVGLHTGQVVVGNMGSLSRFDYTIIGDAANLAARLEGINKQFGTWTLISEATKDKMGSAFPVREISRVTVVGRKDPVRVFEPMLRSDYESKLNIMTVFQAGLNSYYEGDFDNAATFFEQIAGTDPPAQAYLERCRLLISNPPDRWDGVWVVREK